LGDYGKDKNIVCDAMGLSRPLDVVEHGEMLSLSEKWVITISSEYGCSCNCNFCDVPKVKYGGKATFNDLISQVMCGISLHPEIEDTERLNVHFARMGEPTWNWNVLDAATYLAGHFSALGWGFHPVVSTMMPRGNNLLEGFIHKWMQIKNDILDGEAGLQLSINSTNDSERSKMFNGRNLLLSGISDIMKCYKVKGRKITLNFAVADWEIDAKYLARLFSPDKFIVKLTPMHKTQAAIENDIKTNGDFTSYYSYQKYEKELKAAGFDVLVFIASEEEDSSLITCGNAVLSGSLPAKYKLL
jgi:23S rRNA (adenine2503-C2)-methyltransferase